VITIPTGQLVGLMQDVVPFGVEAKDLPELAVVHLRWDGRMLHAWTTDRYRLAWAQWHPDDPPWATDVQDDLLTEWGSDDEPWDANVWLEDVKHLVKTFKLGRKQYWTALTLDVDEQLVTVARDRITGLAATTVLMEQPELSAVFDAPGKLAALDRAVPVKTMAFNARFLADFELVRARGPLHLTFRGANAAALVHIGERFVGAIAAVRMEQPEGRKIDLRTATGVAIPVIEPEPPKES
jgi:hypothetical protein